MASDTFDVFEDGVKQTLDTFQEAVAPISIMLAVDASGSMRPVADAVKDAATSFVKALRPADQLALTMFADQAAVVHDLTTKREWTIEGIDQYTAKGGTALNDAVYNSLARLGSVDGRRAIVLLTDGRDENGPGTAPGSRHSLADVLTQIRGVDATIYAIGLGPKVDRAALEKLASASGGEAFFPQTVDILAGRVPPCRRTAAAAVRGQLCVDQPETRRPMADRRHQQPQSVDHHQEPRRLFRPRQVNERFLSGRRLSGYFRPSLVAALPKNYRVLFRHK